jgi:4,5-DOPA dioxygenase extradiol
VLIVGSGNVVHNLRSIDWSGRDLGFDWAHRFDDAARAVLLERPGEAAGLQARPDFARVAPTPARFIPLLYLAGPAAAADRPARVLIDGYAFGSLSMTSYTHDASCPAGGPDPRPAACLPDPGALHPEDTNL